MGSVWPLAAIAIAMAEVIRAARLLGVGGGLAIAALVFVTGPAADYAAAMVVTGFAVAALSIPRGHIHETYGDWHRFTR